MIKAISGGGGKRHESCLKLEELKESYDRASSEAKGSF